MAAQERRKYLNNYFGEAFDRCAVPGGPAGIQQKYLTGGLEGSDRKLELFQVGAELDGSCSGGSESNMKSEFFFYKHF